MRKTKLLPRKRSIREKWVSETGYKLLPERRKLTDSFFGLGLAEEETYIHSLKRINLIRSMIIEGKRILGL